jgi:hypothetical protein
MRRMLGSVPVTLALLLATPATASAEAGSSSAASAAPAAPSGEVHVFLAVHKFSRTHGKVKARGTATATLTPDGTRGAAAGAPVVTVKKSVTLAAESAENCKILKLKLEKVELKLLGLEVNLEGNKAGEPVELTVTGEPNGGPLGSLFCQLANAKITLGKAAAVAKLNRTIADHGKGLPIGLTAQVRGHVAATTETTTTTEEICPVLSLVLGPLHLNLLGLVVELNQIHLTLNANPKGGVLGNLFCGVVNAKA